MSILAPAHGIGNKAHSPMSILTSTITSTTITNGEIRHGWLLMLTVLVCGR